MLAAEAPKITDWMQAWGSLAGLVMSTVAVVFTGLVFRHEIRVRREEQRDNEAAQARLIVGTVIGWQPSGTNAHTGEMMGPAVGLEWQVKNYSQAPIFDVDVTVYALGSQQDSLIRFGKQPQKVAIVEDKAVGAVEMTPVETEPGSGLDLSRFNMTLAFTDASGIHWKRHANWPPERVFDLRPPSETELQRIRRRERLDKARWHIGRWKLWAQVKVLRTRKPEELEEYGTEYDPIPF